MPALPDSLTLRDGARELRRLEPSDRDAVFRACQDAELLRWTALHDPYTEEDAERLMDEVRVQWEEGRGAELAITVEGELVGSIHLVLHGDWRASVAYWLAAEARSHGYATRSVRLLTRWAFVREPRPHRALEHLRQRGVGRCRAAIGFAEEGVLRSRLPYRGGYRDVRCFSLVRGDQGI